MESLTSIWLALIVLSIVVVISSLWLVRSVFALRSETTRALAQQLEEKHRAMLLDLHHSLSSQSEKIAALQLSIAENLAKGREHLFTQLAEQTHAQQTLLQNTLRGITQQLAERAETMSKTVDQRLEQISGRVHQRLEEGFQKTNETFTNVMNRLAVIDDAQKKIEGLAGEVVSLQELLGDKRSRGAFGEVQLEALVRNLLPSTTFAFQYRLSNGTRVDCALFLPEPTGLVSVDAKFPLENYHRGFTATLPQTERELAQREFGRDVKRHVDAIADKYIVPNETSDGAVMFVPAEAVFAEIHAYHPEVIDYAQQKRVWIVSPTTLMAILNTARAVLKDVETRKQVHLIQEALKVLANEFSRFDQRMHNMVRHIEQVKQDAEQIQTTSRKISNRFREIERAELLDEKSNPPASLPSPSK